MFLPDFPDFPLTSPLLVSVQDCHNKCSAVQCRIGRLGEWCRMFQSWQLLHMECFVYIAAAAAQTLASKP